MIDYSDTVLLVEDDELTAELEKRVLARSGLSVHIVGTVRDAVASIQKSRFLAIVLDYKLTDGDPWAVVDAAKAKVPQVPVVIVTAMGSELVAAEAIHRGVAEYVKKAATFWDQLPEIVSRVTRLAGAEEKLRRADALFQLIAKNTSDVILVASPEGRIRYISPACITLFGYQPEELIANLGLELVHPEDRKGFVRSLAELTCSKHQRITYRCLQKDGKYRWVESNINVLVDSLTEAPTEIIAISRDVTDRKQTEEEITKLNGKLETMIKEVHHRVKNNLQVISSLLRMQGDNLTDRDASAALKQSQQRVLSMALIHERLYGSLQMEEIDFGEYTHALVNDLVSSYSNRDNEVSSRINASCILLNIDLAIPCGLILNELVTNALKHAFPKGTSGEIVVEVRHAPSDHVLLTVSDDGVGLPDNFNWKNSRSLGLPIVEILTKQLGGTLTVHRKPGASFTVEFSRDGTGTKNASAA